MLAAAALGLAALGWATGTRLPGGKAGGDKGQGVTRGRGWVGAPRHGAFPPPRAARPARGGLRTPGVSLRCVQAALGCGTAPLPTRLISQHSCL